MYSFPCCVSRDRIPILLKARFFDSIIAWVGNTIIVKGVQSLINMFNPVGAIVQAIITIGTTIKFFIDRAKQIAAFANAVFDSITEIAAGNLKKAIIAVEKSLAKALPVAIGFMANMAGIGGIVVKVLLHFCLAESPIAAMVCTSDSEKLIIGQIATGDKTPTLSIIDIESGKIVKIIEENL